jgi:hypothetical protein
MERQLQRLETPRTLDRETKDKVVFITFIIQKFAMAYKMSGPKAYLFLKRYGGLDYLYKHWWALHTDNPIYAVHDMFMICRRNGGPR